MSESYDEKILKLEAQIKRLTDELNKTNRYNEGGYVYINKFDYVLIKKTLFDDIYDQAFIKLNNNKDRIMSESSIEARACISVLAHIVSKMSTDFHQHEFDAAVEKSGDIVNKVLADTISNKTFLTDENNIDKDRYGLLDYIDDDEIRNIFKSLHNEYALGMTTGTKYYDFCLKIAMALGTDVEDELIKNIPVITYKYSNLKQ